MVDFARHGSVALLTVNSPPVNAIGSKVRAGVESCMKRAIEDPQVRSVVICGKGSTFPVGADIREFSETRQRNTGAATDNKGFLRAVENSPKPVVAAVHGNALGGGFELALSAHYRIAHEKAQFGFPEVELGILPAWCGTQRLPRLAGLKLALDLAPTGRRMGVAEAVNNGVVDMVIKKDFLKEALRFAERIAAEPYSHRIVSNLKVKDAKDAEKLAEAALFKAKTKSRGMMSPIMCIKAVMASTEGTFADGVQKEAEFASVLFTSGQAQALQYAFFAQRAATKWELGPGLNPRTVKPLPLRTGAVIGAGTMGTGIAMCMLNVGMPVVLVEQNQELLDRGVSALRTLYDQSVKLGKMTRQQMNGCLSLMKPSTNLNAIADVDIVIEAVYENTALKQEMFAKIERVCQPKAVLCTNTSRISIDKIASAVQNPERVVGTHFFAPAYYMRLLENVRGSKTSPETIATAMAFGTKIGKVPVLVGNCDGFVGNRMYAMMTSEAAFCVEEGALPTDVDTVLEDYGFPLGCFKVGDLSGLDIGYRTRQDRAKQLGIEVDFSATTFDGQRYCPISDLLASKGRLGRKTGKGWYKYEKPGAKVPFPDEEVVQIIEQHCKKHGIVRRKIPPQEILERCLYSLINEGFKILEEGIAGKPEDIDTVWCLGYGWPRHTGGPMFYASKVGLNQIYDRICHYWREHPMSPHWTPSKLLKRLAEKNVPIGEWAAHKKSFSRL